MIVRQVAVANRLVSLSNGRQSKLPFHSSPDGAAVLPLKDGGYVYVGNSEVEQGKGGVYGLGLQPGRKFVPGGCGLTFELLISTDTTFSVASTQDYKRLLSGTTRNCSGGELHFCQPVVRSHVCLHHTKPLSL